MTFLCLYPSTSYGFNYPYDFGSFIHHPRSIVHNAALLFSCNQSPSFASRLRTNRFVPNGLRTDNKPSLATDETAIDAEIGLCYHFKDWVSLGLFSAVSSYDINDTTKSLKNPLVFPFHKSYFPVISSAISIEPVDNLHVGFAAQFFETVPVEVKLFLIDEPQFTIQSRIGVAVNWNIGTAIETSYGIFHLGYQPAFESDLDVPFTIPLDFSELNPFIPINLDIDILTFDTALDYRPATWQIGWVGQFKRKIQAEIGIIVNYWEELGAEFFLRPQDLFGVLESIITQRNIVLKNTINPYFGIDLPISDSLVFKAGLAVFQSPLIKQAEKKPAVSGNVILIKTGMVLTKKLFDIPFSIEGHLTYGHMKEQAVSGGGRVSGEFITLMNQLSFPF